MKKASAVFLAVVLLFSFPFAVYAADGEDDGGLLGGLVDGFLDGLKGLFIPDEDFFKDFNDDIRIAIDGKTGGLATAFYEITDKFEQLQSGYQTNNTLTLTLPSNHLYSGYKGTSVNVLGGIGDFANWFRGLFSAFIVVITIMQCYGKVKDMFKG